VVESDVSLYIFSELDGVTYVISAYERPKFLTATVVYNACTYLTLQSKPSEGGG
jgi:hypothetical protein